jgi:glycerate 2-kinase
MSAVADGRAILEVGIRAMAPRRAVARALRLRGARLDVGRRRIRLAGGARVRVLSIGKAAGPMAEAAVGALGASRRGEVLVILPEGVESRSDSFEIVHGGHPVPDRGSEAAARRSLGFVREAGPADALLFLISGGGSAVCEAPAEGVSLRDLQAATRALLASGAPIQALNVIRRHISRIKGGRLARETAGRPFATLAISDVVGDAPWDIASGPTAPDPTSYRDALTAVREYDLGARFPESILRHLAEGARGRVSETPKPDDPIWTRGSFELVATNRIALEACARESRSRGYRTAVLSSSIVGETREVARVHAAILGEAARFGRPVRRPACLLSGGETTVTLGPRAKKGGRNQEFALASISAIEGLADVAVVSMGSDGVDGPTDAAGGWADGESASRARRAGVDLGRALSEHDAYSALGRLGQLIRTGPTGTNVMDLHALVAGAAPRPSVRSVRQRSRSP